MAARIMLPARRSPSRSTSPAGARYPPPASRRVYAAAHVASADGGDLVDWEATLSFRDHLWAHGFAVAEAMDHRAGGMGLSWWLARELIASSRSGAAARRAVGHHDRPMPRCAVSMASATAKPCAHRWFAEAEGGLPVDQVAAVGRGDVGGGVRRGARRAAGSRAPSRAG